MKLQIDIANKTIKVEHNVNLGELVNALANMFPDGMWREYTLEPQVITGYVNPIQVYPDQPQQWPWIVPNQPTITYGGTHSGDNYTVPTTSVFNVQYNAQP